MRINIYEDRMSWAYLFGEAAVDKMASKPGHLTLNP